jgi:lipopolysaccharide transport system ATP-binding protein
MSDIAIRAEHLGKQYTIGSAVRPHDTLRDHLTESLFSLFRWRGRTQSTRRLIWALEDISFEIKAGEMVGIIGRNGAGKSTLLKILSRVTEPTRGRAEIYGRVGSLLEVGTGFHQELTGRENVSLSGAILGMRKEEIKRKFDQIVDFAEVEKFVDTPVKHYSSGMYMRLAFAVAAHLNPDILLVDEVLSVGDLAFQRKCLAYAKTLQKNNATVLFVSHNMFTVTAMCDRVIYLSDGHVRFDGASEEVIGLYEKENHLNGTAQLPTGSNGHASQQPIAITDLALLDEAGNPRRAFDYGERLRIRLRFETTQPVKNPNFVVALIRSDNVACCNYSSAVDGGDIPDLCGSGTVEVLTPPLKLISELYSIHVLVWDREFQRLYSSQQTGVSLQVRHPLFTTHFGVFHEPGQWVWKADEKTVPVTLLQQGIEQR